MLYRHWKGGIYKLLHIAQIEATGADVVVYQPYGDDTVWVRPVADFFGNVSDQNNARRFQPITERDLP